MEIQPTRAIPGPQLRPARRSSRLAGQRQRNDGEETAERRQSDSESSLGEDSESEYQATLLQDGEEQAERSRSETTTESLPALETLQSYAHLQVPEKRLHVRQATQFAGAAERCAKRYLNAPSEQALLDFLLLPKAGLAIGATSSQGLGATLANYPEERRLPEGKPIAQRTWEPEDPVRRASRLLAKGWISKAANALLNPTNIASSTDPAVLQALKDKHPPGDPQAFDLRANPAPGKPVTVAHIEQALRTFPKETSPGPSGWSVPLLQEATRQKTVLQFYAKLANQIRTGVAPGKSLLCASRLTALEKENGQVRPIAVGETLYRLVAKAILLALWTPDALLPNQLGVKSPGGVEPALSLLQRSVFGELPKRFSYVASLDFSNAFNSISRRTVAAGTLAHAPDFYRAAKWIYGSPAPLITPTGETIQSEEGVRQGDPLGPLFFSIGIRDTLAELQERLGSDYLVLSYLDDIYILSSSSDAVERAERYLRDGPLQLNQQKCSTYAIEEIRAGAVALEALGSCIGGIEARRAFLKGKIDQLEQALEKLYDMPKQHAFLLLQASVQLLLRHLQRCLDPEGLDDLWEQVDRMVLTCVRRIRGNAEPGAFDQEILALPRKAGGLGIPLHQEVSRIAYPAAQEEAQCTIQRILRDFESRNANEPTPERVRNNVEQAPTTTQRPAKLQRSRVRSLMEEKRTRLLQTLDQHRRNAVEENASYLGSLWLRILPTQKQLTLADSEVMAALNQRMLVASQPENQPCPHCSLASPFGHETTCLQRPRIPIVRHDRVRDHLAQGFKASHPLSVETEVHLPGTQERMDLVVTRATGIRHFDVTIRSLHAREAREPYATLETVEKAKRLKYKRLGNAFEPLVISHGGLMSRNTSQIYQKIQRDAGPTTAKWMDKSIAMTLLRSRALGYGIPAQG